MQGRAPDEWETRPFSTSCDAEEGAGEGDFAVEECVGELLGGVGVVVVGRVEDGRCREGASWRTW